MTLAIDNAGHLVSVTRAVNVREQVVKAGKVTSAVKKDKETRTDYIGIEGTDRVSFVRNCLATHDLANDFSPGAHAGPPFKMSWTGSP